MSVASCIKMSVEFGPINVAVVPAAGDGTRLRPASLAVPKEMLPVLDDGVWKPVIQMVLEELNASGIREAIVVTKPGKEAIAVHFTDPDGSIRNVGTGPTYIEELHFIDQLSGRYGNGVPLLSAEPFLQNEDHVLNIWGDEFFATSGDPRTKQMIDLFVQLGGNVGVISAVRIQNKRDLSLYGIADVTETAPGIYRINDMVEKPDPDKAPSNLAAHGSYLLPTDIVDVLRTQGAGKGGEIWLIDAIRTLIAGGYPIFACEIKGADYCDAGTVLNYFKTIVKRGLANPVHGQELRQFVASALSNTGD